MGAYHKFEVIIPPQDLTADPLFLRRLSEGDAEAFTLLYRNYSRRVFEYALLLARDETLAEDVVQEIFLKIWKSREMLASVLDLNAYLHVMARNYLNNHWKKQGRECEGQKEYKALQSNHSCSPDDSRDLLRIIQSAVDRLSAQRRLVYRLRNDYGWKREEIAKQLQLSPFTVKAHMQKAVVFVRTTVEWEMKQ